MTISKNFLIIFFIIFIHAIHAQSSLDKHDTCDGTSDCDQDNFLISKIKGDHLQEDAHQMDLLYSTPLALTFSYLTRWFYGESTMPDLFKEFYQADLLNAELASRREENNKVDEEEFDFIIVGSGSAGSTVAARLTEDPRNYKVLLLEAGGNPFPLQSVPALALFMLNNPDIDWGDRIVPQKIACQAFKNESIALSRGRGLGGSSNLNFMIGMRGNPNDYDRWAEESEDEEWKFENLLPFFKKMESYHGDFPCDKYHGKDGPLNLEKMAFSPLKDEWEAIGQEMGYEYKDPNGAGQDESFFPIPVSMKDATRFSTHRGYLYPASKRPNLVTRLYSTATKIEFDSSNRAIGVHYETVKSDGQQTKHYAAATKEIILSSGTLGSSKLLMLSGIGPKGHLEDLGIPVKVDLPVGQNLQDHALSFIGPFSYDKSQTTEPNFVHDITEDTLHEYLSTRTGPFAASGFGIGGGAMIASSFGTKTWPDLYVTFTAAPMAPNTADIFEQSFHAKEGLLQKYFEPLVGKDIFYIVICLSLPKTTGEVKLRTSNPFDGLHIDPKYLSHEDDVKTMLEGVKFALKIARESETMKKIDAQLTPVLLPGCESFGNSDSDNDGYWTCFFKHWTQTMWHFTSTAKMGSGPKDKNSVVDSKLRVVGTTGLRVIDNSIQPKVVTTNTNLPAILIGEKGADLILKSWAGKA